MPNPYNAPEITVQEVQRRLKAGATLVLLDVREPYELARAALPYPQVALAPLIIQHELHMGFSYNLPGDWIASLAYVHAFDNSVSGKMINPSTNLPLAGTSIETEAAADALSCGISKRF